MDFFQLEIPVVGELEKGPRGSGWKKHSSEERTFYAIRYFLNCKKRCVDASPRMGPIYLNLGTAERVETRTLQKIKFNTKQRDDQKTLAEHFRSSEELSKLSSELATTIGAAPLKVKTGLSTELTNKIQWGYKSTDSVARQYEVEVTREIEAEYKFDPLSSKAYVVPLMYDSWCYDVSLAMIDWLFVCYERRPFGFSYKRKSYPSAERTNAARQHMNWLRIGKPLCCVKYNQLVESARIVEEDRYKNEVESPEEMLIGPPQRASFGYVPLPEDHATLYQIMRRSFPDKWDANIAKLAA